MAFILAIVPRMLSEPSILNFACYRFFDLHRDLPAMKVIYLAKAKELDLMGTIVLCPEGINAFISGEPENVRQLQAFLREDLGIADLIFKESWSKDRIYHRMLVRVKKQLVPTEDTSIRPHDYTGPTIAPVDFKRWYEAGQEMLILDTRNDYEFTIGTFEKAEHLDLSTFRGFDTKVAAIDSSWKDKPVVMFCTGGIRCEKASPMLIKKGFNQVYQLDGGILNYFEKVGGDHWRGDCFVFDRRVAVTPNLAPAEKVHCLHCGNPTIIEDQKKSGYDTKHPCPHCCRRQVS